MTDIRVDIDKNTRLEVRGRLLYCVRTRKWWGVDIVVTPLERVRLGTGKVGAIIRWTLSLLLAFGVGMTIIGLWSLGDPLLVLITIVLLGFLIGMQAVFPAVVSDVRAWWARDGRVRLLLVNSRTLRPFYVNYKVGLDPEFDSHIVQIRLRQDRSSSQCPAGILFKYPSVRGEIRGLLLDLTIPASMCIFLVAPLSALTSMYILLWVFLAWVIVMYGPSLVMVLWRVVATRQIRDAETAMLDGEYETASLMARGLPARALRSPHALNLLATLALLCGDSTSAANALETIERSTAYQLAFGASFGRFGFRLNAMNPLRPGAVRKLAEYENVHAEQRSEDDGDRLMSAHI